MISRDITDTIARTFPMTYRHQGSLGLKRRGEARNRHLVIVEDRGVASGMSQEIICSSL
jgi:hypothetical protein